MDQNQQFKQEYMPEPKKSAKLTWLGCIFLLVIGTFVYEIYFPKPISSKRVEIAPGTGSRQIGGLLKREGVIRSKWIFVTYVFMTGHAADLKSGEYKFGESSSVADIVQMLSRGGVRERTITIPEGWNMLDIAKYFENVGAFQREEFLRIIAIENARFEFLKDKPRFATYEGYLFPDTYRIFIDTKPEDIMLKMLENFDKKLNSELRGDISKNGKTIHEIVTMASLIEKEVVSDEDRALVSGILWKRLKLGMPLQADATLTYIKRQAHENPDFQDVVLDVHKVPPFLNEKISRADTQMDSAYNTYKNRGLPPGPIANPGLSAIRAAIYPKESPYLYYLSTSDGKTIFSKTLEEHNGAKAKYLRN